MRGRGWKLLVAPLLLGFMLVAGCRSATDTPVTGGEIGRGGAAVVSDTSALGSRLRITQHVYVPVYSHIYHQDRGREFDLAATLSIRNTDPEAAIYVTAVRYYDSGGQLVRHYVERPLRLGALASVPFVVAERDRTGGVGANFIVEWAAEGAVSPPVIETVMISTASQQGISFVSRGQVIERDSLAASGAE